MRDGGDQLGVAALGAAAGLGAAQGDHQLLHRPLGAGPHVAGGDQHLAAAGQQQIALRLAGADGETAVRVGQLPPAAAVEVLQREDVLQSAAEGGPGVDPGQPGGGTVEADHPARRVGDHQAVRKVVRIELRPAADHGCPPRLPTVSFPPPRQTLAPPGLG